MIDIVLYGTPRSWQVEMERQGYDVQTHTFMDVINTMENIESTESFDKKHAHNNANNSNSNENNGKAKKKHARSYQLG